MGRCTLGLGIAVLLASLSILVGAARIPNESQSAIVSEPKPPVWPESYTVEYTFSLPYTAKIQPHGIRYPVVFHRDAEAHRTRMDTYNGTNVIIATKKLQYELTPRIDVLQCLVTADGSLAESIAMPDITGWEFGGEEALEGAASHLWRYTARHQAKVVNYKFWVSPEGAPLRLSMHGNDALSGAHFDDWVADYTSFHPGVPHKRLFESPELCADKKPERATGSEAAHARASSLRAASLLPQVSYRGGHDEYDAFLSSPHGAARRHSGLADYAARAAAFAANAARIQTHNTRNASYTMAMNRFGDWHREEFVAAMLPRRSRARLTEPEAPSDGHKLRPYELPYRPLSDPSRVPASVTWRGSLADSRVVKDQACCGSCWAFGAAGSMEAAWYVATGQRLQLAEQQIMDCAWGVVPGSQDSSASCDGGDAWAGITYAAGAGGLATNEEYQYRGQAGYCMSNVTTPVAFFKGYTRVPPYNDALLMEAVYTRGPLAVSLDASQPSFTFYSSGVYAEPACFYKKGELDHSMMLEGYGTGPEGDYWLIRNSWSENWGDAGYIKVSRDNHGCGATADAAFAIADVPPSV